MYSAVPHGGAEWLRYTDFCRLPFILGSQLTGHFLHTRIPPVENGPFRLDFFRLDSCGPSYRQSSRFYSFCALPRGAWCEGILRYGSRKWVGSSVCASCVFREQRVLRARRTLVPADWWLSTNPRPSGLVALGLAESRQSYVRGVVLSRELPKLQQQA